MTGLVKNAVKLTAKGTAYVHHAVAHGQNKTTRRFNYAVVTTIL